MIKKEFLIQYVLTRTSHKRTLEQLLKEAVEAWDAIERSSS